MRKLINRSDIKDAQQLRKAAKTARILLSSLYRQIEHIEQEIHSLEIVLKAWDSVKEPMSSGVKVEPHSNLNTVDEAQFRKTAVEVMQYADQGVQTLVLTANGAHTVVGLNSCRFLPDPPDIEEINFA